ncbi:sterol desaturase family protein [Pedobacter segetis]|nr:sterol desaturase family protein [Pedobacter segetis]
MYYSYSKDLKLYQKKDTLTNIYLMVAAFLVNLATQGASLFVLDFFYRFRFFEIENIVLYYLLLFVAQDFLYWALHALGHFSRFFWAIHVTHHSSNHFNITTGFRSTVFEPLYRMIFYIPLPLMGFQVVDVLFIYLLTQMYGNIIHTQTVIKFPNWFEYLFVTPSHHRVHHASNIKYLDKNMGMVLIIWDRWFGTFQKEMPEEKVIFGITKPPVNDGLIETIFHEFKNIKEDLDKSPSLNDKLKYIFYAPGWSHDGSSQTARVMQRELKDSI